MKNNIIAISLVFTLVFVSAITFAEETTELRAAKIDMTYTPQKDGIDFKIKIENTGEMPLEAMSLKIFYNGELSDSDPVSIDVGEIETFNYTIPKGTNIVEASLSRGGLGIKFSRSTTAEITGQELSTTVHFSKEFFLGRGDVYDFEMAGKPIEIEQNSKGIVELTLKNTGTVDLDINLEAESELKINYLEEVSLEADKTKKLDIEVFSGDKIGSYSLSVTGKTKHLTRHLPVPIEINVVEKPPTEPIIQIIKIIHEDSISLHEESKVVVQMKNIGLGKEIDIKLDMPENWEVQPDVAKKTIKRHETVNVIFYIVPHTEGKEKINVRTDYGSKEFEISAGRSLFSYILILLSIILLILILILTNKLIYEFRKEHAVAVIILLIILYITCWKSFILPLWVIVFLIAVPVLIYSYYRRKKAKEKGGLEYVNFKFK